ncbi:hypothetical protein LGH82_05725 [Mesorhizobium sp. PAMC28654]|uniref:hypothetical protein n=1 Tax=Mesorhizobium sp. PAMC28654 TaxID=2880934 RepID=UPI001D0B8826|nr:hypothetical protein [Mesorhizobium sp. PAMC28654]UDL90798.1 hypothetical protein LGH82_05725 [Mesorhizobium sp. PAMC28654]
MIGKRASLMHQASDCLVRFGELFDTTTLPAPWEYNYQGNSDEAVWLARAHDGLKSLAIGEFQSVDPDSGNPYDTSHDFLDRAVVESVIWLFNDNGISKEQLKHRKLPAAAAKTVTDLTLPIGSARLRSVLVREAKRSGSTPRVSTPSASTSKTRMRSPP